MIIDIDKILSLNGSRFEKVAIKVNTAKHLERVINFLKAEGIKSWGDLSFSNDESSAVLIDQEGEFTLEPLHNIDPDTEVLTFAKFKAQYSKNDVDGDMPIIVTPLVSDQHAIKELDFNGCKIWLAIDYKNKKLSFVEFREGPARWEPKKWDFSGRGPEYLNGWVKILDAMKSAVEYGKEELNKW